GVIPQQDLEQERTHQPGLEAGLSPESAEPGAETDGRAVNYTTAGALPQAKGWGGAPAASASEQAFAGHDNLRGDQRAYYDQIRANDPAMSEKTANETAKASRPLSDGDRDAVKDIQKKIATMKPKRIDDPKNPNLVQIELAFDGSGEDRATQDPALESNPAKLDDAFQGPKHYERGVGSEKNDTFQHRAQNDYEFVTGAGFQKRVDGAYNWLVNEVNGIKGGNPQAQVVLVVTGFSRGAAEARAFTNELNARGIPVQSSKQPDGSFTQHFDTPHVGVMVLFDTVQMTAAQHKDLSIPDNVDNVLHITARDEKRTTFPLTRATDPNRPDDNRITEVAMPGSHGDIGGGRPNEYSNLSQQLARQYMTNAGVNIAPDEQKTNVDDPDLRIHDTGNGLFGMQRPVMNNRNPK
ncbi:MAG TPA: DUF2235 domain-containing protein, partial [Kofleriaceae bacterium]